MRSAKLGNARLVAGVFVLALLSGCASFFPQTKELAKGWPEALPKQVELTEVPFFPQLEYQCGPAALATVLVNAGVKTTPNDLVPQVYIPERKGSLQVEMLAAARRHGLVSYALAPRFEDVLREIAAGTPVIVLQNLGLFSAGWHYAVAVGYDYGPGTLVLRSGTLERDVVPFAAHEVVWMRSGYWAMVAVPPERIPATAEEKSWLNAIAAFERAGDAKRARVAYKTFLGRWPENVNAHVGLANTHHALGELAEAASVLREAARRDPESVVVLNNLAQTLSDLGRYEEALPVIERAAAAGGPFAPAVQKTRETILQKLGRQSSRVERLQ
ncbi:MAG TPA: PA2778 family cysteine peptidase [Burkholderiales bacterium]|nr:PA2778 family cysteine peptidase [Burkholderiales bacterium]